jgi:large subunit ribosomal protein L15
MKQHQLAPPPGTRHARKRIGRGLGSGHGRLSGRGGRGQQSKESIPPRFEGGQLPLYRRLTIRRGFRNPFRKEYRVVNVASLNVFEANAVVTPEALLKAGLVRSLKEPVKLLGEGTLTKPLQVKVHKFSASAKAKIEQAGGQVEEVFYP